MSAIYLNGQKLTGADNASNVIAQDVLGLVEQAGDDTTVQALLDEIADRVADKLLTKTAASSLYLPQSVQNVVGCKNLLPNTAATKTENGLTFTVNADGSVTVNGTATADTYFNLNPAFASYSSANFSKWAGCILSGCTGGSDNTYKIAMGCSDDGTTWAATVNCFNNDVTVPMTHPYIESPYILVKSGVAVSNKLFKPMIRPASYKDSTYEPYAMTNRELTAIRTGTVTPETNSYSAVNTSYSSLFACGKIGVIQCYLAVSSASPNGTWIKVATMSEQAAKENIIQVQEFKNGGNLNGIQFKLDGNSIYARPMVTGNYQLNASFIIK